MSVQRSARLRRFAPLFAAVALALPASSAAAPGCAPAGARVLASSGAARIYSAGGALYGCLGSRRTRLGAYEVGRIAGPDRVVRFALASPYAAVDTAQMGVDTFRSSVYLYNLASGGAALAGDPAARPLPRPESFVNVTALVVSPAGIAAWSARSSAIGMPKPSYELHAMTAAHDRLIAAGTAAFTALRLSGHTLSWRTAPDGRTQTRAV